MPISFWDEGGTWDSGLVWDPGGGPSADISQYLNLVTSEHKKRVNFIATLSVILQPLADITATLATMNALFDLDVAVGVQLDVVGQWVGISRNLAVPITGVYFSFDTNGLGFDQGTWRGPFDPSTDLVSLPDDAYRLLLQAKVLNNSWDGTIPSAYAIWNVLFAGTDQGLLIQDYGNMHMLFALTGALPDAVTLALFKGGVLNNRPDGVTIDGYLTPSVPDTPYFGFDVQNASIAGFDTGAWGIA